VGRLPGGQNGEGAPTYNAKLDGCEVAPTCLLDESAFHSMPMALRMLVKKLPGSPARVVLQQLFTTTTRARYLFVWLARFAAARVGGAMRSLVFLLSEQQQVLGAIIRLVMVHVVDVFAGQGPTNNLSHDPHVLPHPAFWRPDAHVAAAINASLPATPLRMSRTGARWASGGIGASDTAEPARLTDSCLREIATARGASNNRAGQHGASHIATFYRGHGYA